MITLSLISLPLPTGSNEELVVPYGNERVWAAGKANWDTIPLRVNCWVDRNVEQAMLNWRRVVYDSITGAIGLASVYKKQATVTEFGPNSTEGNATFPKTYMLHGVWPIQVSPGVLDMTAGTGQVMLEAVLRYDKMDPLIYGFPGGGGA